MPIDSPHPLYAQNINSWKRCRDAYAGEEAVKTAGAEYLPKLGGQSAQEYEAYKMRALYFEAVGRTVDGYVGSIARKPAQFKVPDAIEPMLDDITGDGVDAQEFIKLLSAEVMLIGRAGILVDFDESTGLPYLAVYRAESILNWTADMIVLSESVFESPDGFEQVEVPQLRQLSIQDGRYTVTLWRKIKAQGIDADKWQIAEVSTPVSRGKPLQGIPFFWLAPLGGTTRIEKPPLMGLVNVSLSHYRNSADLEHGRHFTGLPTLYVAGERTNPDEPVKVGSMAAIILADPNAKVGYAEFTGQGLQSLETALKDKEHMMSVLGAATFSAGQKGVEAAETARIRTSGENSLLMGIVGAVETVLESALEFAASWMGASGEIDVDINRDFIDVTMSPMELQQLVGAYQAGTITLQTFLWNLQEAEMLAPDRTIEDEMRDLQAAKAQKAAAQAEAMKALQAQQPDPRAQGAQPSTGGQS